MRLLSRVERHITDDHELLPSDSGNQSSVICIQYACCFFCYISLTYIGPMPLETRQLLLGDSPDLADLGSVATEGASGNLSDKPEGGRCLVVVPNLTWSHF